MFDEVLKARYLCESGRNVMEIADVFYLSPKSIYRIIRIHMFNKEPVELIH